MAERKETLYVFIYIIHPVFVSTNNNKIEATIDFLVLPVHVSMRKQVPLHLLLCRQETQANLIM